MSSAYLKKKFCALKLINFFFTIIDSFFQFSKCNKFITKNNFFSNVDIFKDQAFFTDLYDAKSYR